MVSVLQNSKNGVTLKYNITAYKYISFHDIIKKLKISRRKYCLTNDHIAFSNSIQSLI